MALVQLRHPLSDDELLDMARLHFHLADREGATDADQAALRSVVPALIHRLRERSEMTRNLIDEPVLDLRFCGTELPESEEQIELSLPLPE